MFYKYEYNPSWIIFIFYFDFKRDENMKNENILWIPKSMMGPKHCTSCPQWTSEPCEQQSISKNY